ncbi:interferon-inducible GTPase 1-like isoform X2 [Mercenaria mercenaria]|uniref:interferon-inducible GTPase 1-like isoform X2 n=1 Tax=Mercenaria mercenaria TaxID=6596 RepID=UPI00234F8616|nr:interferon-inducible GTPase 1-like isoform X2 [Mercenaria mercenaria]XP_053390299.1 interferon-inducible GTPase 1-like isoform X2 [Mercenaria mercenaria]
MAIDEGSAEDSTVIDEGKIEKTVEEYVDMALTSDEDLGKELLEDEDIKAHFLNYGLKNLHAVLQKALEKHDRTQLSIAIIGQTGTGKSSLINALMDLHSGEEGAAAVGEVGECTTNCKEYKHPKLPNLSFWDVPGVDSPKFPRMSYIEDIKVENYDFFLLVYSGRLKDSEIWLKSELDKLKKKCYFVYTKVDNDILSVTRREQNSKEEDVFMQLKSKSMNNMRKISSPGEVPKQFLISSLKPKSFDFPKLSEQLIDDAPDVKKLVLIYSVGANSKKIIEEKAKALRKRCWPVVLLRAFKLLTQVPAESKLLKLLDAVFDCLDIAYIIREITFYQEQFGLTDDNLEKITEFKQVSLSDLKSKLQLKTNSIQLNGDGLKALFHNSEAYLKQKVAQLGPTSFIESLVRITESHKFAECFLEMILDNMKEDALKVLEFITKGN